MRPSRTASWRTALQAIVLGAVLSGGFILGPASALEAREDPLTVAEDQPVTQIETVGESVGEPAAEDAPVEGEPGPGDTVRVPPDDSSEQGDSGETGDDVRPPAEDTGAEPKPAD